jgi:hypothetical protein
LAPRKRMAGSESPLASRNRPRIVAACRLDLTRWLVSLPSRPRSARPD